METKRASLVGGVTVVITLLGLLPRAYGQEAAAFQRAPRQEVNFASDNVDIAPAKTYRTNITECGDALSCDDGDPCTVDSCLNGRCQHDALTCDDQNRCTKDSCVAGACHFDPIHDPALGCGDTPPPPPPPPPPPVVDEPQPQAPPVEEPAKPTVDTTNRFAKAPFCWRWSYETTVNCLNGGSYTLDDVKPLTSIVNVPNSAYTFAVAVQHYEQHATDANREAVYSTAATAYQDALEGDPNHMLELVEEASDPTHLKLMNTDVDAIKSLIAFNPDEFAQDGTSAVKDTGLEINPNLENNPTYQKVVYILREESMGSGGGCGCNFTAPQGRPHVAGLIGLFLATLTAMGFRRLKSLSK